MQLFQFKPRHPVVRLAFSGDGRFLATAQPHTAVCVRDRLDGTPVHTMHTPRAATFDDVALAPSGRWLAVVANSRLHLSKLADPVCVLPPWGHGSTRCVRFAPSGSTLYHSNGIGVGYFAFTEAGPPGADLIWGDRQYHPFHTTASVFGFTSDARFAVALRHDRNPVLIDLTLDTIAAQLDFPHRISYARFPPARVTAQHDRVAVGQGECVAVYDLTGFVPPSPKTKAKPTLHPVRVLEPPPDVREEDGGWHPPVAFAPDGKSILTGWERRCVRMWDLESEGVRREWHWRLEELRSLAVAPDGLTAAAGGRLGKVMVWDLDG